MFCISPLKDVLLNLNGSDSLYQMFEPARSRRKISKPSIKEKLPQHQQVIHNIFVLQGHVLVLVGDLELLVFDQVSRLGLYGFEKPKNLLAEAPQRITSVLDLFIDNKSIRGESVIILSKSGQLITWTFERPSFEWVYKGTVSLCKVKDSQISECLYDESQRTLVWCERRSVSHCCVSTAELTFTDKTSIQRLHTVLHNCLPMVLHRLDFSTYCFMSVSNLPHGLMLFWSASCNTMTARIWGEDFNYTSLPIAASDYQTIVKNSISMWIHSPSPDIKFIAMKSHSHTKELVILQNDLQLHLVKVDKPGCVTSTRVCSLETSETEIFAKQIKGMSLFHRVVVVVMNDGKINVFSAKYGLFLWKTDSFVGASPQVWERKGLFPCLGVWNRSGVWVLNAKPIIEQVKEAHCEYEKQGETQRPESPAIFDGQVVREKRRTYKGVSRSAGTPLHYPFEVLNKWNLRNYSAEFALEETMKLKERIALDDLSDVSCLIEQINDPVMLILLFADGDFSFAAKRRIVEKLKALMSGEEHIEETYASLLKEYLRLEDSMNNCFKESMPTQTLNTEDMFAVEFRNLREYGKRKEIPLDDIDRVLVYLFNEDANALLSYIMNIFGMEHNKDVTEYDELKHVLLKVVFRKDSRIFDLISAQLWDTSPQLHLRWLEQCCEDQLVHKFAKKTLQINYPPSRKPHPSEIEAQQTRVFAQLLTRSLTTSQETAFEVYLERLLINDAVYLLNSVETPSLQSSLFVKLFVHLLKTDELSKYASDVKECLPAHFDIIKLQELMNTKVTCNENVFVTSHSDVSIGDLKDTLGILLEK